MRLKFGQPGQGAERSTHVTKVSLNTQKRRGRDQTGHQVSGVSDQVLEALSGQLGSVCDLVPYA